MTFAFDEDDEDEDEEDNKDDDGDDDMSPEYPTFLFRGIQSYTFYFF